MRKQTPEIPSGSAPDRLSPELERLLRVGARRRQLSKNEVLYTRGSAPDSVFCVESGAVQLSATSVNGREAVLGVAEQGRWFGELTLFINAPRVHDARALVKTELLVVPARRLHEVVDNLAQVSNDHSAETQRRAGRLLAARDADEQAAIRARMPVVNHRRFFSQGAQRPAQQD